MHISLSSLFITTFWRTTVGNITLSTTLSHLSVLGWRILDGVLSKFFLVCTAVRRPAGHKLTGRQRNWQSVPLGLHFFAAPYRLVTCCSVPRLERERERERERADCPGARKAIFYRSRVKRLKVQKLEKFKLYEGESLKVAIRLRIKT